MSSKTKVSERHGWYSATAEARGGVVYELIGDLAPAASGSVKPMLEGGRLVVEVTSVTNGPTTIEATPDLVYVGRVGAYVRGTIRDDDNKIIRRIPPST